MMTEVHEHIQVLPVVVTITIILGNSLDKPSGSKGKERIRSLWIDLVKLMTM